MGDKQSNVFTAMLCRNSFLNVLNLGTGRTRTLLDTRLDPGPNQHGNSGNHNSTMCNNMGNQLVEFIKDECARNDESMQQGLSACLPITSFGTRKMTWSTFCQTSKSVTCMNITVGIVTKKFTRKVTVPRAL
jgi:hypothetical protein